MELQNAGVVAANLQLFMQSVVGLVRSQVYHIEHPPYLFAVMQYIGQVCQ